MSDANKLLFLVETVKSIKELKGLRHDIAKNNINLTQIIPFMYLFEALIIYKLNNSYLFTGIMLWYFYTFKAGSKAIALSTDINDFTHGIQLTLNDSLNTKYTGNQSTYSFIRYIYLHLYSTYLKNNTSNNVLYKTLYTLYNEDHPMLAQPIGLKYHALHKSNKEDINNVCYLCGKVIKHNNDLKKQLSIVSGQIDHIIPVVPAFILGILNFPLNYAYTHSECNSAKSDDLPVHETNTELEELYIKSKYNEDLESQFKYTIKDAYDIFAKLIENAPTIKENYYAYNPGIKYDETDYYIHKLNYGFDLIRGYHNQIGGLDSKSSQGKQPEYQKPASIKKSYSMLSHLIHYFEDKTQSFHNATCINSITTINYLIYSELTGYFKFVLELVKPAFLSGGAPKRKMHDLDTIIIKYLKAIEDKDAIKNISQQHVWDTLERAAFLKYRYKCSFLFSLEYFKQSTGKNSIEDYVKFIEARIQHTINFTTVSHLKSAKEDIKYWFSI